MSRSCWPRALGRQPTHLAVTGAGHQAACCRCRLHAQGFNLPAEGSWFWVEGMIDLFFYVDLVLNFFVAFEVCQQDDAGARTPCAAALLLPRQAAPGNRALQHRPAARRHTLMNLPLSPASQDPVTGDVIANRKQIAARYLKVCCPVKPADRAPQAGCVRACAAVQSGKHRAAHVPPHWHRDGS